MCNLHTYFSQQFVRTLSFNSQSHRARKWQIQGKAQPCLALQSVFPTKQFKILKGNVHKGLIWWGSGGGSWRMNSKKEDKWERWAFEVKRVAAGFESTWNILETGTWGDAGVCDTLVVISGEETKEFGKLRAERLSCKPVKLGLIYRAGAVQLWSAGYAAPASTEGLLAMEIPGPHSQMFWFNRPGTRPAVGILSNTSDDSSKHSQVWKSVHWEPLKYFTQGKNIIKATL